MTEAPDQPPRRVRADARRNTDALLEAASAVFATSGSTPRCGRSREGRCRRRDRLPPLPRGVPTSSRRSSVIRSTPAPTPPPSWPPSTEPARRSRAGCSAARASSPPSAGWPQHCTRDRLDALPSTSTGGSGRRSAHCSRPRSRRARSGPTSSRGPPARGRQPVPGRRRRGRGPLPADGRSPRRRAALRREPVLTGYRVDLEVGLGPRERHDGPLGGHRPAYGGIGGRRALLRPRGRVADRVPSAPTASQTSKPRARSHFNDDPAGEHRIRLHQRTCASAPPLGAGEPRVDEPTGLSSIDPRLGVPDSPSRAGS